MLHKYLLILQVVMFDHLVYWLPVAWLPRDVHGAVVGSNICDMCGEVCLYVGYEVDSLCCIIVAFRPQK